MSKIKKVKVETDVIKRTTYRTTEGLTIVETAKNDEDKTYNLFSEKKLSALVLDVPKDSFKEGLPSLNEIADKVVTIKDLSDIDKYFICYIDYSSEIIFDINKKIMTKTYTFDYIGSLSENIPNDPIYKELIEKLKEHPFILELSEEKIPYYNSNFSGQKAIKEMKIKISQEKYEEIYKEAKEKDKEFWSVRMSDAIKMSYENNFNIYGKEISKLLIKYHNQERIYSDN